jgi:hypothetical protein
MPHFDQAIKRHNFGFIEEQTAHISPRDSNSWIKKFFCLLQSNMAQLFLSFAAREEAACGGRKLNRLPFLRRSKP